METDPSAAGTGATGADSGGAAAAGSSGGVEARAPVADGTDVDTGATSAVTDVGPAMGTAV
jgi:hypothetical protein